jgi:hypothetical protein
MCVATRYHAVIVLLIGFSERIEWRTARSANYGLVAVNAVILHFRVRPELHQIVFNVVMLAPKPF